MLRVENEVHIQQFGSFLVGQFVKQHVQEIAGVVQVRIGSNRLQSLAQPVVSSYNGRAHGRQADALADSGFHGVVVYFGIKCRQRGKTGAEGVHRVAVLYQVQYLDNLVGNAPVCPKDVVKLGQLLLTWQVAVKKQVDDLFKGGFLRQVVDVVAPIQELSHLAVNETGLGGIEINVLKSLHNLRGH